MVSRTQDQIRASWNETAEVAVSVVCATYNHELYISEAIEGFLIQETNFPFEIIIHDDASTDSTATIIREYASKYPAIIRPIFQSENQYSKGDFKPGVYAAGFAKGEYIALCEGDDYWVDSRKLQLQFHILNGNEKIDFCCHPAYRNKNKVQGKKVYWKRQKNEFTARDILTSRGMFAATASYFFRRQVFSDLPDWFCHNAPVGDFFLEMYGSKRGGGFYIPCPMSVYRVEAVGSWTQRIQNNHKAHLIHCEAMLLSLSLLQQDFLHLSSLISAYKAQPLLGMAMTHLKTNNHLLFRQVIEESFNAKRFFSIKQSVAYFCRRSPILVLLFLRVIRR